MIYQTARWAARALSQARWPRWKHGNSRALKLTKARDWGLRNLEWEWNDFRGNFGEDFSDEMNGSWLMGPVTTKTVKICSPTRVQCFFAQVFCHYFVPPKPWCTTKTDFFLSPLQVPFPLLNIYQISQPLLQNLKWTREIKHHWGVCWKQGEIYLFIYQTFRPCSIFSWGGTVVGCNI